ncbi:MAG: sulfurtransferase [Deltaproteobacteria bacterium]|nr:sulfurtransferase [Deltaproteobacteria bacterium]
MSFGPILSPEALRQSALPIRLLDARAAEAYAAGHLPGALHADPERALSAAGDPGFDPRQGGRHPLPPLPRFAAQLGAWGVGPDTWVVAYDAASGGNAAARLWWMLRAVGHERVAVLDGGLAAAAAAGLAATAEPAKPPPARPPYPATAWRRPLAALGEVERRIADPAWKVLDVRSRERWRGETEPYDPPAGRIPGTVNLPYTDALGPDGRFLPADRLKALYLGLLGGTPPERLVVHCGSGITACHTLLALELAGLSGSSLYVGSYSEWCRSGKPLGRG